MAHKIDDVEVEEEEYDETADEDFNPITAAADDKDAPSSSEEEEDVAAASTRKDDQKRNSKRKAEAMNELDSGDEVTIQQRKKKRREGAKADDDAADDSGGEGGLVRTRAQRQAEKAERKQRSTAGAGEVTIDVQRFWKDLSSIPLGRPNTNDAILPVVDVDMLADEKETNEPTTADVKDNGPDEELVTIKRRIEYAGEVTEVEEQVPRSSKAARDYLAPRNSINRPLVRPSIFEPNPSGVVKGVAPDKLRPRAPNRLDILVADKEKAKKLTTVQKSAMDWSRYVEKEGLREELDEYGKSKRGYLAREDFLGRVVLAAEGRGRDARMRG